MRRRTKAISATLSVLGGFAVVIADVPSYVPLEGPKLAAETTSITNEGVDVQGNVPPGFVESIDVPSAGAIERGVRDNLPAEISQGGGSEHHGNDAGGGGGAGAAAADEAAARAEARRREAAARAEAAEAEADARDEAEDREDDARDEAGDARDDAEDERPDFDRDDFEP